jgi:hypothetical protein
VVAPVVPVPPPLVEPAELEPDDEGEALVPPEPAPPAEVDAAVCAVVPPLELPELVAAPDDAHAVKNQTPSASGLFPKRFNSTRR